MSGGRGNDDRLDDEAHLAALLAVLSLVRADEVADGAPLQRWRARRLAALASAAVTPDRPARPR